MKIVSLVYPRANPSRLTAIYVLLAAMTAALLTPVAANVSSTFSLTGIAHAAVLQATKGLAGGNINPTVTPGPQPGTAYAVQRSRGNLRELMVIEKPAFQTTTEVPFALPLPPGDHVQLTQGGYGPALVFDRNQRPVAVIAAPWGKATNGALRTHFTRVMGNTLYQSVQLDRTLNGAPVAFPVVIDPYFRWYALGVVITLSYDDMAAVAAGGIYAAESLFGISIPTGIGVIPASAIAGMLATITAGAAWGYATHNCFWFWMPYPWTWDLPSHGYYKC